MCVSYTFLSVSIQSVYVDEFYFSVCTDHSGKLCLSWTDVDRH